MQLDVVEKGTVLYNAALQAESVMTCNSDQLLLSIGQNKNPPFLLLLTLSLATEDKIFHVTLLVCFGISESEVLWKR